MTGTMKRLWGFLLVVALISQPMGRGEIDDYVSHPGNIPDFHNFSTPQLEPGQEGDFSLNVHNRYGYSLDNVNITAEIYQRADIDESESLDQISSNERPFVRETCWNQDEVRNCVETDNARKATFNIGTIASNVTILLKFEIVSKEDTKEGTYFVRFSMNFDYNSTSRVMQSRGHWSMEQWEDATTNLTEGSPGNINLEALSVDGIIPDSSFGIKKPIPLWPLYVLITLTIVFAGLSVIFYLEEEGTYPELNKWLQKQRGKFNQLRLRLKYRKGG